MANGLLKAGFANPPSTSISRKVVVAKWLSVVASAEILRWETFAAVCQQS